MGLTTSMSVGRVAIMHDIREEISANIDPKLTFQNEIFIDKLAAYNHDIEAYTNARFQPVLDEYNSKQSRPERKKDKSYVEYIKDENDKLLAKDKDNKSKGIKRAIRKPTKLCHEYVIQVGNRETNGTLKSDIELNKRFCREVLEEIQNKYPHAEILLATYHADEPNGTPHMHILVQFVGEGYKQGLSQQLSISKALECDGLERSNNRGDYAINRWTKDIQDTIMTDTLKKMFQEDREVIGETRAHEDIRFFREKARVEAEALEERAEKAKLAEASLNEQLNKTLQQKAEIIANAEKQADDVKKEALKKYEDVSQEREKVLDSIAKLQVEEARKKRSIEAHDNTLNILEQDIARQKLDLLDLQGNIRHAGYVLNGNPDMGTKGLYQEIEDAREELASLIGQIGTAEQNLKDLKGKHEELEKQPPKIIEKNLDYKEIALKQDELLGEIQTAIASDRDLEISLRRRIPDIKTRLINLWGDIKELSEKVTQNIFHKNLGKR